MRDHRALPPRLMNPGTAGLVFVLVCCLAVATCEPGAGPTDTRVHDGDARAAPRLWHPFLDELQERTFRFFWEQANPDNGLVPDRWPTPSFSSIAAVGFALPTYLVGAEHGWISPEEARHRVRLTLEHLRRAPMGSQAQGAAGYRGFFYHFLDMERGERFATVELSTVDTALLMAGVLACQSYYDGDNAEEAAIRALADELYRAVEWDWARPRPPLVAMGWYPESGFHHLDWRGYSEAMIVYLLALGSPTHPIEADAWDAYTSTSQWGVYYGQHYFGFAPLFGHQYSHLFVDFRGIRDAAGRSYNVDYFESSRRATLAQRAYAIDNPGRFDGYDANTWGFTPCDGPADATTVVNGREVRFFTYAARGASFTEVRDDGTIAPWAAAASLPFAPEVVIPALVEMRARHGAYLWSDYGFLDSFNPTFAGTGLTPQMGRVVPGVGWFASDVLGIDQGPIVLMIESYRNGFVWNLLRRSPYITTGLRRAGFAGGWLERAP
jgi:hypothetical protein